MIVTAITALLDVSAVEIATTYNVGFHSLGATVSLPLVLTTVLGALSPEPSGFGPTFHVTEEEGLLVPDTVALSCTFVFVFVETLAGLMLTPVTVGVVGTGFGSDGVVTGGVTTGGVGSGVGVTTGGVTSGGVCVCWFLVCC